MIRVDCNLTDCCYYKLSSSKPTSTIPNPCDCSHPHKEMHRFQKPCPLYKKDWQSHANGNGDLEKFRNLRRVGKGKG